jgi:hypothetical protein
MHTNTSSVVALLTLFLTAGCGHRVPLAADDAGPAEGRTSTDGPRISDGLAASSCTYEVVGGPTGVSPSSAEVFTPSLAFSGQRFGLVWMRSSGAGHPVVRMRLTDRNATPLGSEVTAGAESHSWAELAHDGTSFGLCWYSDPGMKGKVAFRRINDQGAPLGAATAVGTGDYAGVCNTLIGGSFGWAAVVRGGFQAGGGGWAHKYALARMDPSGLPVGQLTTFRPFAEETTRTGLVRTDKGYLVAYRDGRKTKDGKVLVQSFDAAGALRGKARQLSVGATHAYSPVMLWTGKQALLLYLQLEPLRGLRQIWIRRLDGTGAPLAAPVLATSAGDSMEFGAAWTGTEVALAFVWNTGELIDTDKLPPPPKVFLARLRPDGTRLQPDLELIAGLSGTTFSRPAVAGSERLIGVSYQQEQGSKRQAQLTVAGCPTPP